MHRFTAVQEWADGTRVKIVGDTIDERDEALSVLRVNVMEAFNEAVSAAVGLPLEAADVNTDDVELP